MNIDGTSMADRRPGVRAGFVGNPHRGRSGGETAQREVLPHGVPSETCGQPAGTSTYELVAVIPIRSAVPSPTKWAPEGIPELEVCAVPPLRGTTWQESRGMTATELSFPRIDGLNLVAEIDEPQEAKDFKSDEEAHQSVQASFASRALDSDTKRFAELPEAAAQQIGSALAELYLNCPLLNEGACDVLKDSDEAGRRIVSLKTGELIRFVPKGEHGVTRGGWGLEVGTVSATGEDNLVLHDSTIEDTNYAFALSIMRDRNLNHPPIGVVRKVDRPIYDDEVRDQTEQATAAKSEDLQGLLRGKGTRIVVGKRSGGQE